MRAMNEYGELVRAYTQVQGERDELKAQIQKFRDMYAHNREIMADQAAQLEAFEKRIEELEAERDELKRRNLDPYALTQMAEAAAKLSGRRMTPEWWIDTVASIRNWVMGEAEIWGWGDYEAKYMEGRLP